MIEQQGYKSNMEIMALSTGSSLKFKIQMWKMGLQEDLVRGKESDISKPIANWWHMQMTVFSEVAAEISQE